MRTRIPSKKEGDLHQNMRKVCSEAWLSTASTFDADLVLGDDQTRELKTDYVFGPDRPPGIGPEIVNLGGPNRAQIPSLKKSWVPKGILA